VARPLALAALMTLALGATAPGRARAGDLQVNPVLVALSVGERSAVVALRNQGVEPARFEVKVFAWEQTPAGEMRLAPTGDLAAFPALVTLQPGESRNVRVGATVPFGGVERAYRVFLEELPPPQRPAGATGVQVLSRIGIPVFLQPSRHEEKPEIQALRVEGGRALFALANRGNVHVRPSAVRLVFRDAAGAALETRALEAWYVLAGGERAYSVVLPAETCRRAASATVEVDVGAKPLRAEAAVDPSGCDP
jgi:fimbrial chaperone protein